MQYNMKSLLRKMWKQKISLDDPRMSELVGGRITRRAVLLALKEGKQK